MLNGLLMAFSMYTTIPVKSIWNEKDFPYIIVSLPIVGFFIGVVWFILTNFLMLFSIPITLKAIFIALIPLLLTGFIHLDGYMDTCDAILSRADMDKKLKILKDTHIGAFASITLLILAAIYYFSIYEILKLGKSYNAFIFIPVFSRGITAIFIIKIKSIYEDGFIANFKKNLTEKHFSYIIFILSLVMVLTYFTQTIIVSTFSIFICIATGIICVKDFKGISGDLCGFMITTSSVLSLCFLAIF